MNNTHFSKVQSSMSRTLPTTHNTSMVATVCCLWLDATTAKRSACSHRIPIKPGWHLHKHTQVSILLSLKKYENMLSKTWVYSIDVRIIPEWGICQYNVHKINQINKVIWHFVENYYIRIWTWKKLIPWQQEAWQQLRHKHQHRFEFCYCAKCIHGKAIKGQNVLVYTWTSSMNMLSAIIYPSESAIKIHVRPLRLFHTGVTNTIYLFFCISDSNPIIIKKICWLSKKEKKN